MTLASVFSLRPPISQLNPLYQCANFPAASDKLRACQELHWRFHKEFTEDGKVIFRSLTKLVMVIVCVWNLISMKKRDYIPNFNIKMKHTNSMGLGSLGLSQLVLEINWEWPSSAVFMRNFPLLSTFWSWSRRSFFQLSCFSPYNGRRRLHSGDTQ